MTQRILGPSGNKRRRRLLLLVPLAAVAALVLALTGSATNPTTGASFEAADGNLVANGGTPNFDWNSFRTGVSVPNWVGTAPTRIAGPTTILNWQFEGLEDAQATTSDSGYAGGTKQADDCASVITAKSTNKGDLKRIYLASRTISGHTYLMLAWARIPQNTTSSSAHISFEFNQDNAGTNGASSPCGTGHGGLVHRSTLNGGDLLVLYDFEGGAADTPTIRISRWTASGWSAPVTLDSTKAQARVDVTGIGPVSDTIAPTTDTLGLNEFGEAGIDLTDSGVFAAGSCFSLGNAVGETRTSGDSSSAAMDDIVGPGSFSLTNCAKITLHKTGVGGAALAGAGFTLYNDVDHSGTFNTGDTTTGKTCTTDASGNCTTQFTNLQPGDYCMVETTTPAGYSTAAAQCITLATTDQALTFSDTPLLGTINVHKQDDQSVPAPLAGAVFTLFTDNAVVGTYESATDIPSLGTCTTLATGDCSFTNVPLGTYCVVETTGVAGYDTAAPQCNKVIDLVAGGRTLSLTFTDPRKFKAIVLVCRQVDDQLYSSAVTIDGTSGGNGNSLTDAQFKATLVGAVSTLTLAQQNAIEAKLCHDTSNSQGAKDGLHVGAHKADPVTIP